MLDQHLGLFPRSLSESLTGGVRWEKSLLKYSHAVIERKMCLFLGRLLHRQCTVCTSEKFIVTSKGNTQQFIFLILFRASKSNINYNC